MIKTVFRYLMGIAVVSLLAVSVQAETFKEGVDYKAVKTPGRIDDSSKIEVREFFWYGCPHCFKLEPYLETWLKTKPTDVNYVRTPGVMNRSWETHGKAFYAAKNLGILDKSHTNLFDSIHRDKRDLKTQKQLAKFYTDYGVTKKEFNDAFESFGVSSSVRQADAMGRAYRLMGVPTIVVNGKYITNGSMSKDYKRWMRIVDYLVELERKNKPAI
ncbi:MAG: thiol:disulfide interchange protein DsbA/DsbL [Gammaproteobacteria bacterium]|nr:thiol:disulfide interchange protein DsbA/DsbL [Gammaproteobacteria bacterium]